MMLSFGSRSFFHLVSVFFFSLFGDKREFRVKDSLGESLRPPDLPSVLARITTFHTRRLRPTAVTHSCRAEPRVNIMDQSTRIR